MSDTKISALTAVGFPLDHDWQFAAARSGSPGENVRVPAWALPILRPEAVVLATDFWSTNGEGQLYTSGTINGGGYENLGAFGIARLTTGTSSSGAARLTWVTPTVSNNSVLELGLGEVYFAARVRIPVLDDGTDRFAVRLGLTPNPDARAIFQGVFFEYDPTATSNDNWWCVTRRSNTERAVDSGVAASTTAHQILVQKVNADATSIISEIDGTVVDTNTTNIPDGPTRKVGLSVGIRKSAGTTSRDLHIDWLIYANVPTSGRPAT
jgi:hypothetical protein